MILISILSEYTMRTYDLMNFVARDMVDGVSDENICISWDVTHVTLVQWRNDPQFSMCLHHARLDKQSHIPTLFPTEKRNLGLPFRI